MAGICLVKSRRMVRSDCRSLCVIGDPGCDGLSSASMRVYEDALRCAAACDLTLVAGDLVPEGDRRHYETICTVTDTFAPNEVFALRGNHDTGTYGEFFGLSDYAVDCDGFTLIVLDNATRRFPEDSLAFLKEMLGSVRRAVIAFHIPVPNAFCGNAVAQAEADKLWAVCEPYKERIAYFVCGHVHSRFVAEYHGIPLICTGGGGAVIEDVSPEIRATDVQHHVVMFKQDATGALRCDIVDLPDSEPAESDPILQRELHSVVAGELMAHLHYLTLAERSSNRGDFASAALFRALAESEYRHARNFFALADSRRSEREVLDGYSAQEQFEAGKQYPMMATYAADHGAPAARLAWKAAGEAERLHDRWLKARTAGEAPAEEGYEVCPACGFARKKGSTERCPMCGAPARDFIPFTAENVAR